MKAFFPLLAAWCLFVSTVWAQAAATLQLSPPPDCGAICLKKAILASPCGTNQTCICTDAELTATAEICVFKTCTVIEQLATKNYSMASCQSIPRDQGGETLWIGMSFFILSVVIFSLRIVARIVTAAGMHWDDYVMVGAILSGAGFAATSIPLYWHGLGKDIWTLPPAQITQMLVAFYHGEWVYAVAVFFTKLSLLMFYLRVFPAKSFRMQIYVVCSVLVIYSILAVVVSCNQCTPVRGAWLYWKEEEHFKCLDRNALGWASAAINIALDLSIIALPLHPISQLVISKKKKVQLLLMFTVGAFVTVASIIRLQSLVSFSSSTNPTWDYRLMGYWSQIEVHMGNICACMPATYSLIKKWWPALVTTTKGASSHGLRSSKLRSTGRSTGSTPRVREDHAQNFVRLEDLESKGGNNVVVTSGTPHDGKD